MNRNSEIKKRFFAFLLAMTFTFSATNIAKNIKFSTDNDINETDTNIIIKKSSKNIPEKIKIEIEDTRTPEEILMDMYKDVYYGYFDDYNITYPYEDYAFGEEELQELQKIINSKQECDYVFDGNVDALMDKISKNTDDYIKEHPEFINAVNPNSLNKEKFSENYYENIANIINTSKETLKSKITNLATGVYSNDVNEDLCKMQDLKIVYETNNIPSSEETYTLGDYNSSENVITLYLSSFLVVYNSENAKYEHISLNKLKPEDLSKSNICEEIIHALTHELNHVRQYSCKHRIENGQLYDIITYPRVYKTSLIESSAESSIYAEGKEIKDYTNNEETTEIPYDNYRKFESTLLLLSLTDNNKTLDDYYNSIYDSDINSLLKYFNIYKSDDIKSFMNILLAYDGHNLKSSLAPEIMNYDYNDPNLSMPKTEIKESIRYNYKLDILRLFLKNLIDYNLNNPDELTLSNNIALAKIIENITLENSIFYLKDEEGNFVDDQNGFVVRYYDEDFAKQYYDLTTKFDEFLTKKYNITEQKLTSEKEQPYIKELFFALYELSNNKLDPDNLWEEIELKFQEAKVLLEKFPKLKYIAYNEFLITYSHEYEDIMKKSYENAKDNTYKKILVPQN